MKPKRTFESVVSELIEGLSSGEVVLDGEKNPHSSLKLLPEKVKWENAQLAIEQALRTRRHTRMEHSSDVANQLENVVFFHLSHAKKRFVVRQEMEQSVAKANDRIWLLVGGWAEYSLTLNILWDVLYISKLQVKGKDVPSPAQHDIRIIVTETREWQEWSEKFKERGLTSNVRLAKSHMDGWMAFADSNLFVDLPKMTKVEHEVFAKIRKQTEKSVRSMFVVEERSEPQEFHHLEEFFDELWKQGSVEMA